MADWVKVGMDGGVGVAAGALDQLAENRDVKAAADYALKNPGKKLPMLNQFGTYVNYVIPLVIVGAVAMGKVRGDMATRLTTSGFQLASRKVTKKVTTPKGASEYSMYTRAREVAERAAERTYEPEFNASRMY